MNTLNRMIATTAVLLISLVLAACGGGGGGGDGDGGGGGGGSPPPAAGKSWGTPQLIETYNTGDAAAPQVVFDASGNAVAVWVQFGAAGSYIFANRYVAGSGWGTPQPVEGNDVGDARGLQVANDANGNAIAVWAKFDGARYNIMSNRYTAGTGWGAPQLIETNDVGTAGSPQIALDANGNAIAVWSQVLPALLVGQRVSILANRYTVGSGWGTAQPIETDNTGDAFGPQVAFDASGNAIAVWYQNDGTRYNIMSNRYTAGTGWGTAQRIDMDNAWGALDPQVALNPNGNAIAVWRQNDGTYDSIWANRYTAGTGWGTAQRIETANIQNSSRPQIALDSNGNAIAVWEKFDSPLHNNIWANRYTAGTGWGSAQLVETDAGNATSPYVATDSSGNAIAVWQQHDGTRFNIWANHYR